MSHPVLFAVPQNRTTADISDSVMFSVYFMKNGRGWARSTTDSVRDDEACFLPKFTPSKTADFGSRAYQLQPMIWKPPSSLLTPKRLSIERPMSAPPYRGQPLPVTPTWNNVDSGQQPEVSTSVILAYFQNYFRSSSSSRARMANRFRSRFRAGK